MNLETRNVLEDSPLGEVLMIFSLIVLTSTVTLIGLAVMP